MTTEIKQVIVSYTRVVMVFAENQRIEISHDNAKELFSALWAGIYPDEIELTTDNIRPYKATVVRNFM